MSERCDAAAALRAAAAAHHPDRERMLARVERGIRSSGEANDSGPARAHPAPNDPTRHRHYARPDAWRTAASHRPRWPHGRLAGLPPWARAAGAAVALAGTLGLASAAVGWVTAEEPAAPGTGPPSDPADGVGQDPPGGGAGGDDGRPARTQPGGDGMTAAGEVDPGSNPYWTQSNVTVTVRDELTSFVIELHVAREDGMRATGAWRTLPAKDFDQSVATEGDELVFRWELREGARVPAGEHVFAGQFDHDAGPRDSDDDWYRAVGSGPGGTASAHGGFE